jgi:hypothetical protein
MSTPVLHPGIKMVRDSMSVTRYILPKRDAAGIRKIGWLPLGMGAFITVSMIFWMSGPILGGVHEQGGGRWLSIGFGLLGLPGLGVGLGLLAIGFLVLTNAFHSEIVVGAGLIRYVERIGPIPLTFKRPIASIARFVIQKGMVTTTSGSGQTQVIGRELAVMRVEMDSGKPLLMAPGYSAEMLRPIADTLAAALTSEKRSAFHVEDTPVEVIEVEERDADAPPRDIEVPRPATTDITCQETAHGLAIAVPPAGLWKGSQGLFFFSLLWNGFMVVFTAIMIFASKEKVPVPVYLFVALFWAIGIGLLRTAINMGKRKILIAIVNDAIAIRTIGPFKTTEQKVAVAGVVGVRVGPSGVEVNDRPLMELQLRLRDGAKTGFLRLQNDAKIGLLSQRSGEEKEWLASVLRRYLKVGRGD